MHVSDAAYNLTCNLTYSCINKCIVLYCFTTNYAKLNSLINQVAWDRNMSSCNHI